NIHCTVETVAGKIGRGFGSMPLGNVWSFPSRALSYDQTLDAMKRLVERIAQVTRECKETGHPIDLTVGMEPAYLDATDELTASLKLPEKIPVLCTLVCASAFDAALHDGYGKVPRLNCYHTYGPDFVRHDLGHYLGAEFKGERLDRYISREPKPR